MIANVLTDYFVEDLVEDGILSNSFSIEVHNNYVTVDRKHQHTSLIESKTIKVEKDVIVYLHKKGSDVYNLECKWLWRNSTIFENLSFEDAKQLELVITQISTSLRRVAMLNNNLSGIQVGDQLWASKDINLDMGLESKFSGLNEAQKIQKNRLYSYTGAQRVEANYPEWRIPTVEDFEELFNFFGDNIQKELTGHLNFFYHGFYSDRIPSKEMKLFLELNPALRAKNGGFYWTSNIEGYDPRNENMGKRKYVYLNRFSAQASIEESVNANDNFFSLRLIHR